MASSSRRLPELLYKYRAFSMRAVADMASNRVFLSSPRRFNDAFDGKIPWSEFLSEKDLREIANNGGPFADRLNDLQQNRPELFSSGWRLNDDGYLVVRTLLAERFSRVTNCGICSLSAVVDDLRMWAHYADSRQGFCLGFATQFAPFCDAVPVRYRQELQEIDAYEVLAGRLGEDQARAYLLTKSDIWREEQEFRVIGDHSDSHAHYPPEAIRTATFGDRTPIEHMVIAHGALPTSVDFFVISPTGGRQFEQIHVDREALERYR